MDVSPTSESRDLAGEAGRRVEEVGDGLRRAASRAGEQGGAALRVAGGWLRRAGDYLERRQLEGVRTDVEGAIVTRPVLALLAAVVVGYALGRVVRG